MKPCKHCGRPCGKNSRGTQKIFCNQACFDLHRAAPRRSCELCGRLHKRKRFCSRSCYDKGCNIGRKVELDGYVSLWNPDHPLAFRTSGRVLEHRAVMFDHCGDDPMFCHWCGLGLNWKTACVDHLNEVRTDNRIENLVVSCNQCNRARGACLDFIRRVMPCRWDQFLTVASEYQGSLHKAGKIYL